MGNVSPNIDRRIGLVEAERGDAAVEQGGRPIAYRSQFLDRTDRARAGKAPIRRRLIWDVEPLAQLLKQRMVVSYLEFSIRPSRSCRPHRHAGRNDNA
jgi:hypothetical protein